MSTILVATRNAHKIGEIRALLGPGLKLVTLRDFPAAPAVIEDAATFAGNAQKKAESLARWLAGESNLQRPEYPNLVLADDSGLDVDILDGAPGVHSARFAALDSGSPGNSSDADNSAKLLRLLGDRPAMARTARFRCVLALTPVLIGPANNGEAITGQAITRTFAGVCEGRIGFVPRGNHGFGYDPLFIPDGFDLTFAELGEEVKNRISHRAKALAQLRAFWQTGRY